MEVVLELLKANVKKGIGYKVVMFIRKLNWMEKACCTKVMEGKLSLDAMYKQMDKMNARSKEDVLKTENQNMIVW